MRVLARLLRDDVRVRVAPFDFVADGRSFGPGTLVILPEANPDAERRRAVLSAVSAGLAADDVFEASGTHTEIGFDLGSPRRRQLLAACI